MIPSTLKKLAVPIASLKPYPRNARRGNVEAVKESLTYHGQYRPIVVRAHTNEVLAGNHTLAAAKELGWQEIAATFVDVDDDEAARINLVDNRANDLAGYDDAALADLLSSLPELDGTGYGQDDLAELLAKVRGPQEGLTDPDAVPEPPAEPVTKLGDLWLLGEHRLLCGDATVEADRARLLGGAVADLVFTDPPYGISYLPQNSELASRGRLKGDVRSEYGEWDVFAATLDGWCGVILDSLRAGGCYYVCMGWEHLGDVIAAFRKARSLPYTVLTWDRVSPRMTGFPQDYIPVTEFIVYGWKRGKRRGNGADGSQQTTLWRFQTMRATEMVHTTQKPVELVENALLNSSYPGEAALDLFAGSGTTVIAAVRRQRRAYLMEIDPKYADVSCRRFQEFTGILPVLEATGEEHDFTNGTTASDPGRRREGAA